MEALEALIYWSLNSNEDTSEILQITVRESVERKTALDYSNSDMWRWGRNC